jgi:acetyl-CoA carboxylase biotin carboxyl carrier protein
MPNEAMKVDTALIRELAELLTETDLTEIEVADGDRRIRVARQGIAVSVAAPPAVAAPIAAAAAPVLTADADIMSHVGTLKSPMVGTVYLASEPGKPNFVTEGQAVTEGQTVVIIEAMKVMNPITAHKSGIVRQILVKNEQPVEYDQPLLVIE